MKLELAPGGYVLAVSGGVDSVVLLDLLAKKPELKLVVAHFDHGIRGNSTEDRKFVERLAKKYRLPFVYGEGKLGPNASEALAREKRYELLEKIRDKNSADAIVTAHHQDDLLETVIINLLRGTNRRGLSSLKSTDLIRRPLLGYSKPQIKEYAKQKNLYWREDPTNTDTRYLRNYVRHELLNALKPSVRQQLLAIIDRASFQNSEIDELLAGLVPGGAKPLDRDWFRQLDKLTSLEVMAAWLRASGVISYDRKTLIRLANAGRDGKNGTKHNFIGNRFMLVSRDQLALKGNER